MKLLTSVLTIALAAASPAAMLSAAQAAEPLPPAGALQAPDAVELAAFKKEIRALYDLKEKAFADGDADAIVNHFYAENAVSVGPDGKPMLGRAAFLENYRPLVERYNVKVESIRTHVQGDSGWDWTNFRVTSKDGSEPPFTFIILFLWNKVDGRWICPGDMYVVGELPQAAE